MRNPVAMPEPFGYKKESPCTLGDLLAERKKREYIGCVEKPDMEKIVSESMKEVYAKRSEELWGREDAGDVMARQVGGNHYKTTHIQPWDIFAAYGLDPWSANVVKYILRFPHKAGRQDLEKAKHYIDYLIKNYTDVTDKYYA